MKKFTIVARPNHNHQDKNKKQEWVHFFPQYNSKSLSTRLRSDPDSLGEAEKILKDNSGFSLEIIHPKSNNHYTVCIWESDRQPNKYYIQNPRELDTFDTTARDNLLYLPKLHYKLRQEVKQFIEFRNLRDDKHYRYQVIEAEKLGFPPSLASTKNSISEGFFKQVGENDGVNPEILELDYDEAATAITNVNMDDYQEAGWLNPVILTLALDGSDIKHIYNAKDGYLKSLNLFLEQSSIILVEPHIDDNYDLRISLLIKFHNLIQQAQENKVDSQNFSLVEYFLFGSQCVQPWKPFLALDLLEGKFYARQQVHQIQEIPIITWEPPQDMPANKHWFAKHWREKWKNMQQETSHSQINIVPPPYQARPYRPSKGLDTLPVNSLSNPLTSILSKHPQFNLKKTNLLELFEDFEKENSRKLLCDNFFSSSKYRNNQSVLFDGVEVWSDFSTNHFAPKSQILIAIPKQENSFFDIVGSVNLGAYRFFWSFFNCFDSSRERDVVKFYNDFGWWNDWHSTIFNERWNVCLRFIERRGFILQKSSLDRDYLGSRTRRVDWQYPNMRFSCPTENNAL